MKVKDLMVGNVRSCTMDTKLDIVALTMWDDDCGSMVVIDGKNKPTGIITDRDVAIAAALQHKPLWDIVVSDVVGLRPLYSCKTTDDIHTGLHTMQKYGVRRLPVVNSNGKLAGILSLGDVFASVGVKETAELPFKETLGMLKAVSGHHSGTKRAG